MVEREGMRRGGCGWGGGVLGRWSLRRLLLDSPLVGRRLAHSVLDQGERPVKLSTETAQARPTVQYIAEDEEGEVLDCPLCLSTLSAASTVRLAWCAHRCCEPCLRQYLAIEIFEARVPVNCPVCHESMHPSDVRRIVDNPTLYDKYEEFSVRRALAADPDTRWCPAPDCSFAVVATGCASCPKLTCLAPGCGASFCYHCKAAWHPTQTCDAARRSRQPPPRAPQPSHSEMEHGEVKPCPRCSVLIVKVEDGSCNHMVCCVCGAEFCWLCMKEVSDLHYLSPSGCTFWGKKPWSRKKKLLWQLGTLAGAPLGIAVVAGVALPALLVGLPLWAGRRAHRRLRRAKPARRRAAVAAAVAAALLVSPLVAGLAVGIGVPILLFYVYGVVPVSLCRAGGCAAAPAPFDDDRDQPADHALDLDAASRRLEPSIGEPILLFYVYGVVPVSLCRAGGCAAAPAPFDDDRDQPADHALDLDAASRRLEPSIGEPILLFYVYGVVPVSLCRAGGCAAAPAPFDDDRDQPADHALDLDAASRRLEPSIGEPILLFYVYGVVPVSLCRAGGCAAAPAPFDDDRDQPADHALDLDAASRRLEPSIGEPILLFYVYGVVPVSLCRAGGCAAAPAPFDDDRDQPADHALDLDAASRRLEPSIGDASLSAGSQQAEVRAPSLAGLAGSLGGHEAASPAAHRLEVTADVAASDTASAASWPDDLPSTSATASASRSAARLRSLFLYGSAHPPPDPEVGECLPPPLINPSQRVELSSVCETRPARSPSPGAS